MTNIKYRTADVDGSKVFYREAGPAGSPKLLLLHGFPTAGHMFRDLNSPSGRPLSYHCSRPAGLWQFRHAGQRP
jgi:pimeloyl-ACP methyl ester carboxylesterase